MMVLHSHGEVEPDVRTIEGSLRKFCDGFCFKEDMPLQFKLNMAAYLDLCGCT